MLKYFSAIINCFFSNLFIYCGDIKILFSFFFFMNTYISLKYNSSLQPDVILTNINYF